MYCIFFFKQKTAYEMRISDWSSDVCSSDLRARVLAHLRDEASLLERSHHAVDVHAADRGDLGPGHRLLVGDDGQALQRRAREAGRLALEHEPLDVGGDRKSTRLNSSH